MTKIDFQGSPRLMGGLMGLFLFSASAWAQDWPKFQGPDANGQIELPGMNFKWGEEGPLEAWSAEIGPGFGGAAICDGEVYLHDRVQGEKDVLRVFDLLSGDELWRFDYSAPGRMAFPGSRTVPTVTEDAVYTAGGFGHVYAIDRETQELKWKLHLIDDFDGELPMFGFSAAPIVHEGIVYLTPLGENVGILAVDADTGKEIWKSEGIGYSHSTPVVLNLNERDQLLFLSSVGQASGADRAAPGVLWSFDPKDGTVTWKHEFSFCRLPIPPPILVDDSTLFLTGGYSAGSVMLGIEEDGDSVEVEELFRLKQGSQTHPPILYEDHLYVIVNENQNDSRRRRSTGGLMCVNFDGEEVWRTGDSPYFGRGSMILVNETLVIQDGDDGTLRSVRPSPTGYSLISEADAFGTQGSRSLQMWAPLAASEGYLVMRSQDKILCFDLNGDD